MEAVTAGHERLTGHDQLLGRRNEPFASHGAVTESVAVVLRPDAWRRSGRSQLGPGHVLTSAQDTVVEAAEATA